ncbi:TPA: isoleucine--tRNA ligase [Candidatus Woesearchaeota archaeon]|nr:isoleucine--tRNA ligase [Candidatus Woesearchaeota archaeon]HIH39576.1 isoleucine--tRNA ligase [Candidatus Woesearchaeota archaeon]
MNYDPQIIEKEILEFWTKNKTYEKMKAKGVKGKPYYFLQGPPYTSGALHMGHAWNSSMKDTVLRYKRMQGFDVWDRSGYDMHGLPTELKVQALFGAKTKEDIIKNIGEEKFAKECEKFCIEKMNDMIKDLKRMAVWMDHDDPYMPITNDFIESEWWLIKKAHDKGRLYEGLRTLTWCYDCASANAKHELEYRSVTDKSVFVKLPIVGKEKEYLIIWTTTVWTLPFNLAVMVNPDLEYVKIEVHDGPEDKKKYEGEKWWVAKGLVGGFMGHVVGKKFAILREVKGEELEGIEYKHPFSNIIDYESLKQEHKTKKIHTVILSKEYVDLSAGSGLVHCAPGCGPEDYEVGHKNGLPPFNFIDEQGVFPKEAGKFAGLRAKIDDKKFIEELDKLGVLIATVNVEHDYAHCWRCKNPIIFRTTKQWFLKIEDSIEKMRRQNERVHWVPSDAKEQYDLWIKNLRDNSITKQRFWGTPAPIWRCQNEKCSNYIVVASSEELKKLGAKKIPSNLHKPWIDAVELPCKKCNSIMNRIPDVLDVWLDSGTLYWNCLKYPQTDEYLKKYPRIDFILEAREQIRLWFSMLNICSNVVFDKDCFDNVYCTGMLLSIGGEKMSKSLGNVISPYEIIDKHGVDTMRYYLSSLNAGENLAFSWDEINTKQKHLTMLWNLHKLLIDITINEEVSMKSYSLDLEDKYILSRANSTLKKVTELMDEYRIDECVAHLESLITELSRTYIQLIREKLALGSKKEKSGVFYTINYVLKRALLMFNIVCPFICEKIYQNLSDASKLKSEYKEVSINLYDWPKSDSKLIDAELETSISHAKYAIQSILSSREKIKRGVRWPVSEVVLVTDKEDVSKSLKKTQDLIASQTNVKKLIISDSFAHAKISLKPDFSKLGPVFGKKATSILAKLITMPALNDKIQKEGKAIIIVDSEKFELKKEHFTAEHSLPKDWVSSEFPSGICYLNAETNKDLEAEGFAREVMRKVQTLRKDSGLQKTDEINLFIETDDAKDLVPFKSMISERCGAKSLNFSGKGKYELSDKIKDKNIKISFDKI